MSSHEFDTEAEESPTRIKAFAFILIIILFGALLAAWETLDTFGF